MDEYITIKSVQDGDGEAYRLLVERYHVGLIIHCERLVKDRQLAEDLSQEAFVTAYKKINSYNIDKSKFSTWLYRIASNKSIDYLRKQNRELPTEDIELIAQEAAPDYEAEEQKRQVRSVVSRLEPPSYRQVIEAYYWEGKTYEQIAADMNKPINTIRTWLRRAKESLRSELS